MSNGAWQAAFGELSSDVDVLRNEAQRASEFRPRMTSFVRRDEQRLTYPFYRGRVPPRWSVDPPEDPPSRNASVIARLKSTKLGSA
jgi:hypothetical protein